MRFLVLSVALIAGAVCAGCSEEDTPPVFIKIEYQVRCLDCEGGTDEPVRKLERLDGEMGTTVMCNVSKAGDDRSVSFSASFMSDKSETEDYALSILQANVDKTDPGSECLVRFEEAANSYEGGCTDDEPEEERPCQVDFTVEGDLLKGSVYCDTIPNRTTKTQWRHVVAPREETEPATFEVHGCVGL